MSWFKEFMYRIDDTLKIIVFYGIIFFLAGFASGRLTF